MTHACSWRLANPDKPHGGSGTHCWGWSCRTNPANCSRKARAANRRKAEQSAYRKFPGSAVQQARQVAWDEAFAEQKAMAQSDRLTDDQWQVVRAAGALPRGHCSWCGGGIRSVKNPSALDLRRSWHSGKGGEPDCLWEYYLHTRMPEQLAHLRKRDGPMCAHCGEARGSDVDHRLALGLVVLVTPMVDRWTWWGPGNLQLLCHPCHVAKTRADVVAIKRARQLLAGVAAQTLLL